MKIHYVILGIIASILFPLSAIYQLYQYGNVTNISMGGFETALFWIFIAGPLAFICLIIFIVKIIRLKKIQSSVKREAWSFLLPVIICTALFFAFGPLSSHCQIGAQRQTYDTCFFIPGGQYPYNKMIK
jgi:hypothetical protein